MNEILIINSASILGRSSVLLLRQAIGY